MFKLASSTMFKPVNNHVEDGQLNHVHVCRYLCDNKKIKKTRSSPLTTSWEDFLRDIPGALLEMAP